MQRATVYRAIRNSLERPRLVWILLGFSLTFACSFVYPIFLSSATMQFPKYINAMEITGVDVKWAQSFSHQVFVGVDNLYEGPNMYPPLASVLLAPLLLLTPEAAYRVVTVCTLASYAFVVLGFPLLMGVTKRISPAMMLVFVSGLVSYGLQFELERGQFNISAIACSLLAVWLFHRLPRHRYWAYVIFCVAVQLKLYPFILVLLLIRDWRDWQRNLRRIIALALANVALMLIFGPRVFTAYMDKLRGHVVEPPHWFGHSVGTFVTVTLRYLKLRQGWAAAEVASPALQLILLGFIALCLSAMLISAVRANRSPLDEHLLLGCLIVALLVPSTSADYKLPILAAPMAYLWCRSDEQQPGLGPGRRFLVTLLTFALALAYSSILYSYATKPFAFASPLNNNAPALLAMLVIAMSLCVLSDHPHLPAAERHSDLRIASREDSIDHGGAKRAPVGSAEAEHLEVLGDLPT